MFDESAVTAWLELLHGQVPGLTHICSVGDWSGRVFDSPTAAARYVRYLEGERREGIYARVSTLRKALEAGKRGGVSDTLALPALWADIDIAGPGHQHDPAKYEGRVLPPNVDAAMSLVTIARLPVPSLWIHSGGGLYPIWLFDEPWLFERGPELGPRVDDGQVDESTGLTAGVVHQLVDDLVDGMHAEVARLSADWQKALTYAGRLVGWHYGSGIGDLARVLRIPGTVNRKAGLQRPCKIISWTPANPGDIPGELVPGEDIKIQPTDLRRYSVAVLRRALSSALSTLAPPPGPAPGSAPAVLSGGVLAPPRADAGPRSAADPGQDFNLRARWPEILSPHGWRELYREGEITYWVRPGKMDAGKSASTNALGTDRLHVFSSEAAPFLADESYNKHAAVTLLEFGGDFAASTRELRRRGFGEELDHGARQAADLDVILGPGWRDRAAANMPPGMPGQPGQPAGAGVTTPVTAAGKYFDSNGALLARALGDAVASLGPVATGGDDLMWSYARGVWSTDKHVVRNRVTTLLGDRYRPGHRATVEDVVRSSAGRITCDPVEQYINFRNGLLDWRSGELLAHSPDVATTVQLGVDWAPGQVCPRFDEFVNQVVPLDMVSVVWELIGYLMYSGNPLHKAVMLTGTGRNGKGTLLRTIVALLGARNVTAVSLHDLVATRFSTASLFGRLANIAGDIDATYLESTAIFKAITGQDPISAEHKGRDRFDFTPWATPVFSANEIPPSSDTTIGYLSRWLVIPFPHSFLGKEDRNLDGKLHAELAGIAVKGVDALRKLLDRGEFERPPSAQAAADEFARRVDVIRAWVSDCCDLAGQPHDPAAHPLVPRTALYQAYKQWCARDGHRAMSAAKFFDRLEAIGATPGKVRGARGFRGISIIDGADVNRLHDLLGPRAWGVDDSGPDGPGGAGRGAGGGQLFDPNLPPQNEPLTSANTAGGAEGAAFTNPLYARTGVGTHVIAHGGVSENLPHLPPPAPPVICGSCDRELDPVLAPYWQERKIHPSCPAGATS